MADEYNVAVWDACVLISAIDQASPRWPAIEPWLRDAERGEFQIVVPETVVAELRYLPVATEEGVPQERQDDLISKFLLNPYIVRRSVHRGISELAATIGRKHKSVKRVGDAIVLATALFWQVPVVHTYDGDGKKNGLLNLDCVLGDKTKLRIMTPDYGANTLFGTPNNEEAKKKKRA